MTRKATQERQEAIDQLREWIKPGNTVYTILESVSRSGMSRTIRVVVPYVDGVQVESAAPGSKPTDYIRRDSLKVDFLHPNHAIGLAIGARQAKKGDGLVIGGCGMDMGFHLVYSLSEALYGYLRCEACGKYPERADEDRTGRPECAYCLEARGVHVPLAGGYACLGKGKCPSNYHVNHRDRVRCEGTMVYNPDGPNTGDRCYWRRGTGWVIPTTADDPARIGPVDDPETESRWIRMCPTCQGKGDLPNPDGPERWDLLHTDGYAIRHRWL